MSFLKELLDEMDYEDVKKFAIIFLEILKPHEKNPNEEKKDVNI